MWVEVEFEGRTHVARDGEEISFGRSVQATVMVGADNNFVHRVVGVIRPHDGQWRIECVGERIPLTLTDPDTNTEVIVRPGGSARLEGGAVTVSFSAGDPIPTDYELLVLQESPAPVVADSVARRTFAGEPTKIVGGSSSTDLHLSPQQRRLVVALCERRLRNPNDTTIAPSKEIATRLGWRLKRFNKRLDEVCHRFHESGIPNVYEPGGLAVGRRNALVDAAVARRIVTAADLPLLDRSDPFDEFDRG